MSAIFLSYRRDDSSGYAGRLFDNLAERFGRERVFMDIETLEPGMDFVAGIDRAIDSCGAVIAMIGPNWIDAEDARGGRRLDDPNDFIRLEIKSALTRGVRVIPVLVHHAVMPQEQELPEPLQPLCRLQAFEISDNRWEYDVHRLGDVLEPLIAETTDRASQAPPAVAEAVTATPTSGSGGRTGAWLAAAAAVLLAVAGGAWWLNQSPPPGQGGDPLADRQRRATEAEPRPPVEPPAAAASAVETPPEQPPGVNATPVVVEPRDAAEQAKHADQRPVSPDQVPLRIERQAPSSAVDTAPRRPAEIGPSAERAPAADEASAAIQGGTADRSSPDLPSATPAVSDQAPPAESPDARRQREIDTLLEAAQTDLAELRLTRPAGNNAFERYQRVLELAPDNTRARQGLADIVDRYRALVADALQRGVLSSAQRHLDAAQSIDADAAWLADVQREIDRRRRADAQPTDAPEPSTPAAADKGAACLSSCREAHQACTSTIGSSSNADCLSRGEQTCETRYQECMSDTGKMFLGPVSHEAECAGIHTRCTRALATDCAAQTTASARCDSRLKRCSAGCGRAD